jgi:hypothetical protein
MRKIPYMVDGYVGKAHDAALFNSDDDPVNEVAQSVIQTIATTVTVTAGGVTIHLAAWLDPDHWSDDWQAVGVDDPDAFAAALVEEAS